MFHKAKGFKHLPVQIKIKSILLNIDAKVIQNETKNSMT